MILEKPPGMQAVTVSNPEQSRDGSDYQLDWIPSMRTIPRTWGLVKGMGAQVQSPWLTISIL